MSRPLPATLTVVGPSPLEGQVRAPGDKSISHRVLLAGALAEGRSEIEGLAEGEDVAHSAVALAALGAGISREPGPEAKVVVEGGRGRLHPPEGPLDCGNSGTLMRLLSGVLASFPWRVVLVGDASLSARPMDRIRDPLSAMGAQLAGQGARCTAPLVVQGGRLVGIDYETPVPSAQVKSAVLFAGCGAQGDTVVRERVATRRHTEEVLARCGLQVTVAPWGERGARVQLRPGALAPARHVVPGDPSQAAFWVVGGCVVPGSSLSVSEVYAGPYRSGFLGVLSRMGALVQSRPSGPGRVTLEAAAGPLVGTVVEAAEIPSLDEVPILAVAAAAAAGTTVFRDVGELRVKEVDRMAATCQLVQAFGAAARIHGDDLVVQGAGPRGLSPGRFEAAGDHRMAMAAAVAGLAAPGESTIGGFGAVATSYPGFLDDLYTLGGPGAARPGGEVR